jgi:protocatechuate 4,5-dioxygenase alpha chain
MSRYAIDKLFHEVILSDETRQSFLGDPEAFVAGRDLTLQERRAIVGRDFRTLYQIGSHPFLMWCWAEQTTTDDMMTLVRKYVGALENLGVVDFAT